MVSPSRGFQLICTKVAPTSDRFICNEAQQVTSVCVSSSRLPSLGSRCTQSTFGGSGPICLPTSSYSVQGGGETQGIPMQQNHYDSSRVAKHALVLGPGSHVKPDSSVLAQPTLPTDYPFDQIPHKNLLNLNLHAWLLGPKSSRSKASLRQWQHELRLNQINLPSEVIHCCKGVPQYNQCTTCQIYSQLPPVSVPGQEVTTKYY